MFFVTVNGGQLRSANGTNWDKFSTVSPVYPISFGNGMFIGLQDGYVATSVNGYNWIKRDTPLGGISGFIYGKGSFLAFGYNTGFSDYILQSDDVNRILNLRLMGSSQEVELALDGILGLTYSLQISTNLQTWQNYATFSNIQIKTFVQLTNSPPSAAKFYRPARH